MDIFKRMNQRTTTDFSVFKPKKVNQTKSAEPSKEAEEPKEVHEKAEKKHIMRSEPVLSAAKEDSVMGPTEELNPELEESNLLEEQVKPMKVIQFKKPETIREEASVKLEAELETAKSTLLPVFPIVRYLKNKCLADTTFASLVMDENKTLKKCFDYVTGEVKKALNSQNGWLDDEEVYAYAETYYMTSEEEFERLANEKAEEEKKEREAVAKKRKELEEKRKKAAEDKKKKKAVSEKAVTEKVKAEAEDKKISIPESAAETAPKTVEKDAPVMQEQLCLEL